MRVLLVALALVAVATPASAVCVTSLACADAGTNLAPFIDQLCVWAVVVVAGFSHSHIACTADPCPEWLCARVAGAIRIDVLP